ncbi:MAG: GSU2403 family nucleotidyltransferase fold protein [Candidatus Aminicenantales bacterium]
MEKELPRIREALRLLRSTRREDVDLTDPVLGLLRAMIQHKLWESGFEIIGSWCFLLYQKHLPMERYPLRTEDLDILVPRPFKGRSFDLSGLMQSLGFSQRFNPDGSMYFTGNRMKVEFVMKERRDGTLPPLHIKEIALTPQELRHLDLLLADPIVLKLGPGIRAKVPSPSAFLLHKLFLAARPERRDKKEKDIRQAVYVGQYALTERTEKARLLSLWSGLPKKWRALIRRSLVKAEDMMPLEAGVIKGLLDLLR